jgi:AAA+ ATPase superfamily predicted ATPase
MANIRNIIGQVARNDNFFPRTLLIEKLYRKLEDGNHILLSAPRRVGKSSIMHHLLDNPTKGYSFVYVYVESINTAEDFCEELLDEIKKSVAVGRMTKAKASFAKFIDSINVEIQGIKLEANPDKKLQRYAQQLNHIWEELDKNDFKTVIMIDEFPQAVENIHKSQGNEMAVLFLQFCRKQRQQQNKNIRFIYTGSIGLPNVVNNITSKAVINDLTSFEVPPLVFDDANKMMIQLLASYKVEYDAAVIVEVLQKLDWLIPFNVQLMVQELIDIYENSGEKLQITAVEKAFKHVIHSRNNHYFSSYQDRLTKAFVLEKEYDFVIELLNFLSQQEKEGEKNAINEIANRFALKNTQIQNILESLEYDGYISLQEKGYRFNSSLLKMWWAKNVSL